MKPVTWVTAGLIQGQTGVFAEQIQGQHLYVLRYSASVFGNSASMLIAMLGLSGYSNGYQATVAVARNSCVSQESENLRIPNVTNIPSNSVYDVRSGSD